MIHISRKEYKQLADFIKMNYGINLGTKKQALVVGRLHNVLLQKGCNSFSEYYDYITSDKTGSAITTLLNRITTNHTFFMREPDHFDYFKDNVLPYLEKAEKSKDLRIWSAGCSTGEEPYVLAMILDEYFGENKKYWDTRILATDISSQVLKQAMKGEYSNEEISNLPLNWRRRYTVKVDNEKSLLADTICHDVIFRKLNLMEEIFPFKHKFQVIFCRNVMIYFDNDTRNQLVNKFYNLLETGGYLFIGHSESLNREKTPFKYVIPAVFRKM
jgi:chemotaxis protein methyltransferase CheR